MTLSKRIRRPCKVEPHRLRNNWSEGEFEELELNYSDGLTVQQIVELFSAKGERFTEATFRKYVQLGLLPRSVRVGRKGKHRGSQGLYPTSAVRQLYLIRRLMQQGYTIDEIQREFLFMRGDIEALGRQLIRVYGAIEAAIAERELRSSADPSLAQALDEARGVGDRLLDTLRGVERRLTMQARMERAAI
ncbi:MAG: MerR family transcriptional regulator [Myxococcota bacterium]